MYIQLKINKEYIKRKKCERIHLASLYIYMEKCNDKKMYNNVLTADYIMQINIINIPYLFLYNNRASCFQNYPKYLKSTYYINIFYMFNQK